MEPTWNKEVEMYNKALKGGNEKEYMQSIKVAMPSEIESKVYWLLLTASISVERPKQHETELKRWELKPILHMETKSDSSKLTT